MNGRDKSQGKISKAFPLKTSVAKDYRPAKAYSTLATFMDLADVLQSKIITYLSPADLASMVVVSSLLYARVQEDRQYNEMWRKHYIQKGQMQLAQYLKHLKQNPFHIFYSERSTHLPNNVISGDRVSYFYSVLQSLDDCRNAIISNRVRRIELNQGQLLDPLVLQQAVDDGFPIFIKKQIINLPQQPDEAEQVSHSYFLLGLRDGLWQETELDAQVFQDFNFSAGQVTDKIYDEIVLKRAHLPSECTRLYAIGSGLLPLQNLHDLFQCLANVYLMYESASPFGIGYGASMNYEAKRYASGLSPSVKMVEGLNVLFNQNKTAFLQGLLSYRVLGIDLDDGDKVLLFQNILNLVKANIIPANYSWPNQKDFGLYLQFCFSDKIFPYLKAKIISFDDLIKIERSFERDSDSSFYHVEKFLEKLLEPNGNGIIGLRENLFTIDDIITYCQTTRYDSHGTIKQKRTLSIDRLEVLITDASIEILRQKYVSLSQQPQSASAYSPHRNNDAALSFGLSEAALDGYRRNLFTWADLKRINSTEKVRYILTDQGKTVLATKRKSQPNLSLIPLSAFVADEGKTIANILRAPNGIQCLIDETYTYEQLSRISADMITLVLCVEGLQHITKDKEIAKQPGKILFDDLHKYSYEVLHYFLQPAGQDFLKSQSKEKILLFSELLKLRSRYFISDLAWVDFVIKNELLNLWVKLGRFSYADISRWPIEKLELLITPQGERLLFAFAPPHNYSQYSQRNNYQTTLNKLYELPFETFSLMFTPIGETALTLKLLQRDDFEKYDVEYLKNLLSPGGILAMTTFPEWRNKPPFYDMNQIKNILPTLKLVAAQSNQAAASSSSQQQLRYRIDNRVIQSQIDILISELVDEITANNNFDPNLNRRELKIRTSIENSLQNLDQLISLQQKNFLVEPIPADEYIKLRLDILNKAIIELHIMCPQLDLKTYKEIYLELFERYLNALPNQSIDKLQDIKTQYIDGSGLAIVNKSHPEKGRFFGLGKTSLEKANKMMEACQQKFRGQVRS